ncbi:MAG: TIGR04255 family protein [Phycisphaerae bacterium]
MRRAPIVEALIDIRTDFAHGPKSADFDTFHERIKMNYATRKPRIEWRARIAFGADSPPEQSSEGGPVGFLYESEDGKQVVQARVNGFTFSRLAPYEDWQGLRRESEALWGKFRDCFHPSRVVRLAVRFINRTSLPLPIDDLADWLATRPETSGVVGRTSPSFFVRLASRIPDSSAESNVVLFSEPAQSETELPVMFDIDVWRRLELDPASPEGRR